MVVLLIDLVILFVKHMNIGAYSVMATIWTLYVPTGQQIVFFSDCLILSFLPIVDLNSYDCFIMYQTGLSEKVRRETLRL